MEAGWSPGRTVAVGGHGFILGTQLGEAALFEAQPASDVWTSHPSAFLPPNNDAYYPRWLIVTQAEFRDWDTHELIVAGDVVIDLRRNNETRQEAAFVLRP